MWVVVPSRSKGNVHLNVQLIPDRYLIERWAEKATKHAPLPDAVNRPRRFGIPGTNTLRYNRLCKKMNRLASDAFSSDETYEIVLAAIDSVGALVAKKRVGEPVQQNEGDVDPVQTQQHVSPSSAQNQHPEACGGLKNPTRQKPKGRPKASEKRKKPLVEQLEQKGRS